MKKKVKKNIGQLLLTGLVLLTALWSISNNQEPATDPDKETMEGEILQILQEQEIDDVSGKVLNQEAEVIITKGTLKNEKIIINHEGLPGAAVEKLLPGDKVMIVRYTDISDSETFYISDYIRSDTLLILFVIFIVVVILVTQLQGFYSIVGMLFSFIVIFELILPQILNGSSPVLIAIIGAILIIPINFYLSHGVNRKTSVAILGTIGTLIITGFIAKIFAESGNLSGVSSEEAAFLSLDTVGKIDFQGLVLAGIIISVLGILDDITISQSSVVQQLRNAKASMSFLELYKRAMYVGRDHISSMVNTLILVYTGASLPLLLLFVDQSQRFSELINYEFLAEEIISTLVASIGLILAVPITTLLACLIITKVDKNFEPHCNH